MSLKRRLNRLLNFKLYFTIKRFLTLKSRSQTEISTKNQDCPKATANLAVVETAEHDSEAVSYKTRDASSREATNALTTLCKIYIDFLHNQL